MFFHTALFRNKHSARKVSDERKVDFNIVNHPLSKVSARLPKFGWSRSATLFYKNSILFSGENFSDLFPLLR